MQISREPPRELTRVDTWLPWAIRGVRVIVILLAAWIGVRIARKLLRRLRPHMLSMMTRHRHSTALELDNRAKTIESALSKLSTILIWLAALVMALHELTFNIEPMIAGLGVAGLAFGLGAQSLIKDLLGGLFLLLEEH